MSAQSDVKLALQPEAAEKFRGMLEKCGNRTASGFSENAFQTDDPGESAYLSWNAVDWHSGGPGKAPAFPEVALVEDFLKTLPKGDYLLEVRGLDNGKSEFRGAWIDNPFFAPAIQVSLEYGENPYASFHNSMSAAFGKDAADRLLGEFLKEGAKQKPKGPKM